MFIACYMFILYVCKYNCVCCIPLPVIVLTDQALKRPAWSVAGSYSLLKYLRTN